MSILHLDKSIHLSTLYTFLVYTVSKLDQTTDIHLNRLST